MGTFKGTFGPLLEALEVEGLTGSGNTSNPNNPPVPMGPTELSRFERQLGVTLPADYRGLLLDVGGLFFVEAVVDSLEKPECGNPVPISKLFGSDAETSSLLANLKDFRDCVPHTMIPIGDNDFGSLFCLGIQGDNFGRVFLLEGYEHVTVIANSFREFLGRLRKSG